MTQTAIKRLGVAVALAAVLALVLQAGAALARPQKPVLHAKKWLAITGKPLAATAGARMFEHGGNAVDAACAMLAATCTMWDTLAWGGETQALVWNPETKKVVAVNALGVAPTGATAEFYQSKGMRYPPEYGPLSAITPGTPGGLMVMLAEWGKLSLAEVLQPAIEMAGEGYPIEEELVRVIEHQHSWLEKWPFSKAVLLPRDGHAPEVGSLFYQKDLAATLRRLVEAEKAARAAGKDRKAAILAANDLFYRGALGRELAEAAHGEGSLITSSDLERWRPKFEEPVTTTFHGLEVCKLNTWTQGPAMLQALNLLEGEDLAGMGYNSARYIHTVSQAMNMAFADRDFYYGDPDFPPAEPVRGLLSKEYARARWAKVDRERNDPAVKPGDPYPFQGGTNPYRDLLEAWPPPAAPAKVSSLSFDESFRAGTTSVLAADAEGWVVSMTPSGAWVPAVVAGKTGIGLSQRAQQFVTDRRENPFNVIEPGKRPRVTLTPTLVLKDGRPYLAAAIQGGDTQDQNLLQFFLAVVVFGFDVQEAAEAANITSYQMRSSFGDHEARPGRLTLDTRTPDWVRDGLRSMGYTLDFADRNSGPMNAILFDRAHGTMTGGSSNQGDDYGIGW
jgi:gamma-glutamyltranspeptidase / glutathione hydrolase